MHAFIGAGKVGTSLGIYFKEKGIEIRGYFSTSMLSAKNAAALTHSTPYSSPEKLINESEIIWITTPDDLIETVAIQISQLPVQGRKTFIHTSGLLTSDTLSCLTEKGHRVGSVHPLLAFSDIPKAVQALNKTCFFIEGDEEDLIEVEEIFKKTGNSSLRIEKENKPAYHAGACVLSNYLVTLVHASNQLFELAGVWKDELAHATNVLIESVVENLHDKSPEEALTGPIKRGDIETVKKHLQVLELNLPELTELYKALAKETMKIAPHLSKETKERLTNLF